MACVWVRSCRCVCFLSFAGNLIVSLWKPQILFICLWILGFLEFKTLSGDVSETIPKKSAVGYSSIPEMVTLKQKSCCVCCKCCKIQIFNFVLKESNLMNLSEFIHTSGWLHPCKVQFCCHLLEENLVDLYLSDVLDLAWFFKQEPSGHKCLCFSFPWGVHISGTDFLSGTRVTGQLSQV